MIDFLVWPPRQSTYQETHPNTDMKRKDRFAVQSHMNPDEPTVSCRTVGRSHPSNSNHARLLFLGLLFLFLQIRLGETTTHLVNYARCLSPRLWHTDGDEQLSGPSRISSKHCSWIKCSGLETLYASHSSCLLCEGATWWRLVAVLDQNFRQVAPQRHDKK